MSDITTWVIYQFEPGTYSKYRYRTRSMGNEGWWGARDIVFSKPNVFVNRAIRNEEDACRIIRDSLMRAVDKRVDNTEREVACLLSGGLDSSLITALVSRHYAKGKLHTFSIGLSEDSEDLKYARMVADFLGTTHHEFIVPEEVFLENIENVIYAIESYDTTTVRASVGNWLIAKHIRETTNAKVIFNGDGSDEVCGGYLYFHAAPNDLEFDKECRRLLQQIHLFDVLRSDRSISSHGLEARTTIFRSRVRTELFVDTSPYSQPCF